MNCPRTQLRRTSTATLAPTIIALLAFAGALSSQGNGASPSPSQNSTPTAPQTPAPLEIKTVQPSRGEIIRFVPLPGILRAQQQVTLQTRVPGFLKSIAVDIGDTVAAGQRLAEIEAPELIADRAKLIAEVKVAELEFKRLQDARAKAPDLVTPQALDAATGRLEIARAQLERSEILIRFCQLEAPFPGVITARFADPGAYLAPNPSPSGSAIVALADTRTLRARVHVPEQEAALVRTHQPVRITLESTPNQVFHSTIARHNNALDDANHSLVVEADLSNPSNTLRPGMYAIVHLGLERHPTALLVPTDAVSVERNATFVFQVIDGRSKKTPVKLGFQDGPQTEILSGLNENSRIVASAKNAPPDGALIPNQPTRP